MIDVLNKLKYTEMTPVQEKSLLIILTGHDVIAQSKTGSGKTAAFGIGVMLKLKFQHYYPQVLVLCPTRELAEQVAQELRKLARFRENIKILTLCGGVPLRPQIASLEHGAHIIVGTPGRIQDLLSKDALRLQHIHTLVLDEADRMLDLGFYDQIQYIRRYLPQKRQTLLFSATFDEDTKNFSREICQDAQFIHIEDIPSDSNIEQLFFTVLKGDKIFSVLQLLKHYKPVSVLLFCSTKERVKQTVKTLQRYSFSALGLHGDLDQMERNEVLLQFVNRSCTILAATDIAARGLDVKEIDIVINFDLPRNKETYIHRIGRTGRAEHQGRALTLYEESEAGLIETLQEEVIKKSITALEVDERFILTASMKTLCINGGKKHKLRPGDILGALTGELGIENKNIGKINVFDTRTYVALKQEEANEIVRRKQKIKIKKRLFTLWAL